MKILFTVTNEHWVHKAVVARMLLIMLNPGGHQIKLKMPTHKPYENNLNHIVEEVKGDGYDYWLNMDSDNPPRNNPLDLLSLGLDVIGLPTPVWHFEDKPGERPVYWNGYDYDESNDAYREHFPRDGLQKVDAVGSGCMLISGRIFLLEGLKDNPFGRKFHPNGTVHKGTDLSFCERARECGIEIHCHYDYACDHYSELELNEVVKAFKGLYGDV